MEYTQAEILQTVAMTEMEHLDVRTVTLGLSLLDCASDSLAGVAQKAGDKIRKFAARLVPTVDEIGEQFGIRVANKRISITPVSLITEVLRGDLVPVAYAITSCTAHTNTAPANVATRIPIIGSVDDSSRTGVSGSSRLYSTTKSATSARMPAASGAQNHGAL